MGKLWSRVIRDASGAKHTISFTKEQLSQLDNPERSSTGKVVIQTNDGNYIAFDKADQAWNR